MPTRPTLVVLCALVALPLAGCGRDDEADVRAVLERFATATAQKDFQTICDRVFAEELVEQVRQTVPCELALTNSDLGDAKNPKLEVRDVEVDGDKATAVVRTSADNQEASEDTVQLVREPDGWRVAALASE